MKETGLNEEEYWIFEYSKPGRKLIGFSLNVDPHIELQLILGERMYTTPMDSVAQIERLDTDSISRLNRTNF